MKHINLQICDKIFQENKKNIRNTNRKSIILHLGKSFMV